jgi:hypothetical protein
MRDETGRQSGYRYRFWYESVEAVNRYDRRGDLLEFGFIRSKSIAETHVTPTGEFRTWHRRTSKADTRATPEGLYSLWHQDRYRKQRFRMSLSN